MIKKSLNHLKPIYLEIGPFYQRGIFVMTAYTSKGFISIVSNSSEYIKRFNGRNLSDMNAINDIRCLRYISLDHTTDLLGLANQKS